MTCRLWVVLCLLVASVAHADAHRYVIVIGHNAPAKSDQKTLRFADDDAARFFEVLRPGAKAAHLLTRLDAESAALFGDLAEQAEPPTLQRLERVIKGLRKQFKADAEAGHKSSLLFVYAGHGDIENGEGYLTFADGRFRRSDLRKSVLSGVKADRVHLIIDACKSYYLVAGRGPGGRREAHRQPFASPAVTQGVGYILSTSNDADSHEWAAVRGGVFSHEIRSGLLGAADLDGDGAVDYEELGLFVAVANAGISHPQYRPNVFIRPPAGHPKAVLFSAQAPAKLQLDAPASGRLTLTDPRGMRYIDAHKGSGAPLTLALLYPGRYAVRWADKDYAATATGGALSLGDLKPVGAPVVARGDGHHAFQSLFSEPLDRSVMRGYRLASQAPALPPPSVRTPGWVAPTLAAVGLAAAAGAVALHVSAVDAFDAADTGPQIDVRSQESRGKDYAYGAAGAYALATGALVSAAWLYFSE